MFTWLANNRGVESDKGFILRRSHRFFYNYIEGDYVLRIYVEALKKGVEVTIHNDSKWEPPNENFMISENKLSEIERRTEAALKFMKVHYNIQRR